MLDKCSLCDQLEDPRFGTRFLGHHWPLCDGCGGPENEAQAKALGEKLRALPLPPKPLDLPLELFRQRMADTLTVWIKDGPARDTILRFALDHFDEARRRESALPKGEKR